MKEEVRCGCDFLSRLLTSRHLPAQFAKQFKRRMEELLMEKYRNHWDPSNPNKGSAYRCIRINGCRLDPVVREAAKVTGLSNIAEYLPSQLTLWIDPNDVSYRFGEDGSICSCTPSVAPSHSLSHSHSHSMFSGTAPPTQLSSWGVATLNASSNSAAPSPVKRSSSPPVRRSSTASPPRSHSPPRPHARRPSPAGSSYYVNQVCDSFSQLDFAIPVRV